MPPIWKPNPKLMKQFWEAIVDEAQDELNAWEMKFISDIEIRVRSEWPLSEAQEKKLEQIYANKTK